MWWRLLRAMVPHKFVTFIFGCEGDCPRPNCRAKYSTGSVFSRWGSSARKSKMTRPTSDHFFRLLEGAKEAFGHRHTMVVDQGCSKLVCTRWWDGNNIAQPDVFRIIQALLMHTMRMLHRREMAVAERMTICAINMWRCSERGVCRRCSLRYA